MASEFKPAGSLYSQERRIRPQRPEPPTESTDHESTNHVNNKRGYIVCERRQKDGLCEPSVEAVALDLRKEAHLCTMGLPCNIDDKLTSGLTVMQIFKEHQQ